MPQGMLPLLVFLGLLAIVAVLGPAFDALIYRAEDIWVAQHRQH